MFTCRACTRRALTILVESSLPSGANRIPLRQCAASTQAASVRTYATTNAAATEESPFDTFEEGNNGDATDKSKGYKAKKPKHKLSKSKELSVSKRLQFMDDPFHIANEVQRILAQDKFDEAALLTREASKKYKTTVAWNHLIDYQMKNLKLHAAIKTFNEMKKRSQLPNAQTYTIIFSGCALSPHPKLAVSEAVKLYNNMLASERMHPNIKHMNAVLMVCAKAEDIDTMFTIIKTADAQERSPNNFTYTTILNALRAIVDKPQRRDMPVPDRTEEIQETIQRAKAIWEEVMKKWREASLVVDQELVCAMGRILLMGNYHDNVAVFDLIEQTIGIPKDPERLSAIAWKAVKEEREVLSDEQEFSKTPRSRLVTVDKRSKLSQVQPGNNALSMVMTAIENSGKTNLARRYWIIFAKMHGITPDANAWYSLFRALRRGKSSTKTAEYLAEMPKDMMSVKLFRTAMLTCVRDNLNKSSFNNATQVLETMITAIRIPDMMVLRNYLRVAYANRRLFEELAEQKDPNSAKQAWGRQMCVALENLWEPYQIAAKQLTHGRLGPVKDEASVPDTEKEIWTRESGLRTELAALARKMIAAHDRIISESLVPPAVAKRIEPRRNALNRFVVKYFEDREKYEPGWNRKKAEQEAREEKEDDW